MPLRNPAVDWEPWKSKGMRKVTVDKFIAFYTVDTRSLTVTVIRIFTEGRTSQILQRILKTYKLRLSAVDKISTPFYLKIGIDISLHAVGCCILGQK